MKSMLIAGVSLLASFKRQFARRLGQHQMIGVTATCLLVASIGSVSAQADTLSISYILSGGPTGPPVVSGTTLILDGLFTGSVLSGNPALDAGWNPVTYVDHSVADLTTGLPNGAFSITFANGDILSGDVFENVSALIATGGIGPFTQIFTFHGRNRRIRWCHWIDFGRGCRNLHSHHYIREWNPDCSGSLYARAGIRGADFWRLARDYDRI